MESLYILGSGDPFPSPERYGSAYLLRHGDELLMFDCGPATTWKMTKVGILPTEVDNLFFTHHHSDHDLDYPCFLSLRWDIGVGKVNKLNVYGPTLTEELTRRLIDPDVGAFAHDYRVRSNHPMSRYSFTVRGGTPLPTMGPDGTNFREPPTKFVTAKDIGPGKVCGGKDWEVVSAPAEHVQPYLDSLAYRVNTDEGSVVFTGDTTPCQSVAELAEGADVLVFNCVGIQSEIEGGVADQFMCGTTGAGRLARDAGVKKLVLVHNPALAGHGHSDFVWSDEKGKVIKQPAVSKIERAVADVATVFDGEIIFGEEMMELKL